MEQQGGCLCGKLRYKVSAPPRHVTICHCRFCQRATGSAYLVEPVFDRTVFAVTKGTPATYAHISEGSGKALTVQFCSTCGTKLFNTLERLPEVVPVYGGTFDDPDWFDRDAATARHIFFTSAQRGTIVPAGARLFPEGAVQADGSPAIPSIHDNPFQVP